MLFSNLRETTNIPDSSLQFELHVSCSEVLDAYISENKKKEEKKKQNVYETLFFTIFGIECGYSNE